MRNVLQWAHVGLWTRGAAANQQHRRARERSIGHSRDGIGDAWSCGNHGNPEATGELGMGVCHMDGRTLVPDIYDANSLPSDMIPNRLNMTALQTKYAVDAARLQKSGNPGRAGLFVGIQVLGYRFLPFENATTTPRASAGLRFCNSRRTRCKIFPVAVLGISELRMNERERGRL